ncbi:hypothetical protein Nepgr_005666 [Nepenthes gracilis]|uniref:Uncharacterized protein n=1 Tax=Nepenthes gracilis TaxID=150966 RepID=A0AAD3S417_NEPGR|nr:hypothetical protein Nepgr_005666 [Nepenthes gracilis]
MRPCALTLASASRTTLASNSARAFSKCATCAHSHSASIAKAPRRGGTLSKPGGTPDPEKGRQPWFEQRASPRSGLRRHGSVRADSTRERSAPCR